VDTLAVARDSGVSETRDHATWSFQQRLLPLLDPTAMATCAWDLKKKVEYGYFSSGKRVWCE
jgi:hypothetical protein